ncbi:hypothetical protein POJ06DRAFT_14636 [Lipomyces tetrasporus]|uniref:C2H2-type domain-containing protein n=1 Tax=Lipomyces tetrasporus TaxID=54092 RepID=A0AAD7QZD0_9ASCO|nr:uncharacterized protein POJ06DRAFT_14636 [Lipomyces tetrasporus]KAJ8104175.1 hypothetical protein POJ06DRAFT_14636 [Lipomyces tetrasporus]
MALVAPASDSTMAVPTSSSSSSFMLDFNSPVPSSLNIDSLPSFSSSSASVAQLTPGSLIAFTNPFASTSAPTAAAASTSASVPRRQQLVSTEVIGPAMPDMASVFAPTFAGYSPGLMATDMSLFDTSSGSASVNPSIVTSATNSNNMMHTRHMSLALPMHLHNPVASSAGSNVGSPSLLPTDLTHSSNVMAGRRMSLPNNLSAGAAGSHIDPQSLMASSSSSSSSSAYTHLPFVSEAVDEIDTAVGPTPSNGSLAQDSPSPASVPASEPSQYVMQMGDVNSNGSGASFSVDARRMSMPVLSMSNSVNPDGTVPLHVRRKNSVATGSDRSASHSPRMSVGSLASHRSSSVSDDVNASLTQTSPSHHGVAFNPGMVPVAVNSYGLMFHDQGHGMPVHKQQQPESESEEDPLPCEIARIPKAILFNGSRPVPGHLGSTVSVPASNTRNGSASSQNGTAVAALMTTFNSKVSSGTQKKHKCPICHKRFTRPSSLQTHMYSHTGEKPFTCDFRGCGRKFSVVSNLRRHKKIHSSSSRSH